MSSGPEKTVAREPSPYPAILPPMLFFDRRG